MKTIARAVIIVLSVAGLAGCASQSQPSAAAVAPATAPPPAEVNTNLLSSDKARASYAIGMSLGRTFQNQGLDSLCSSFSLNFWIKLTLKTL